MARVSLPCILVQVQQSPKEELTFPQLQLWQRSPTQESPSDGPGHPTSIPTLTIERMVKLEMLFYQCPASFDCNADTSHSLHQY